ncbi:hypothetical protein J15TS10_16560 [Paenibacillus woosongensis]|uniref:Uncharacterized protein n=1 Tax=Paenibacillus woosongensis TaxID=307580 RepID=A0ABQ4MPE3_9BACL|nr:hypothetical protein J15TS10_16560 [Paenibacillus woosongensis]
MDWIVLKHVIREMKKTDNKSHSSRESEGCAIFFVSSAQGISAKMSLGIVYNARSLERERQHE